MSEKEPARELLFAAPQFSDPVHAAFQLWKDVSTRISACHHCKRPIPKRTQRVVMVIKRNQGRKLMNGGWIGKDKLFFHTACMYQSLKLKPRERVQRCVDCEGRVERDNRAFMNKRYIFGRICDKCAVSRRWRLCRYCSIYFPNYMVQRVIREDRLPQSDSVACRSCVLLRELYTAEDQKRDNRVFSIYRKRIMAKLHA